MRYDCKCKHRPEPASKLAASQICNDLPGAGQSGSWSGSRRPAGQLAGSPAGRAKRGGIFGVSCGLGHRWPGGPLAVWPASRQAGRPRVARGKFHSGRPAGWPGDRRPAGRPHFAKKLENEGTLTLGSAPTIVLRNRKRGYAHQNLGFP